MSRGEIIIRMGARADIALCVLLAACPWAYALDPALDVSQYAHTAWKIRDGFLKGSIFAIAQTPDGYLWLGTQFGLLRFDGVRPVEWRPPAGEQLPSNEIDKLLVTRGGTLWIGTRRGLASWKGGKLTKYSQLAGWQIQALLEDRESSIWVGGYGLLDGKLCEIHKGNVRCHPEIGGLGHGVAGLHEDAKGNLWVGLATGVWRWKPGPPEFYSVQDPNGIQNSIQSMANGEDGGLLIPTARAIARLINGKFESGLSVSE